MIRCEHLVKIYAVQKSEFFYALSDINIHIQKGEFVAVLGKSGSRKSTLMNMIGLIDEPSSGKIYIDSIDVDAYSEREKAMLRNQKIGYIFQSFYLDPSYTVYKNVEMPLLIMGVSQKQRKKT